MKHIKSSKCDSKCSITFPLLIWYHAIHTSDMKSTKEFFKCCNYCWADCWDPKHRGMNNKLFYERDEWMTRLLYMLTYGTCKSNEQIKFNRWRPTHFQIYPNNRISYSYTLYRCAKCYTWIQNRKEYFRTGVVDTIDS